MDRRLRTAAEMVREGAVAADIGTDHGYLITGLVASGRCSRGYACDIRPGPLEQARRTIRATGLEDRVAVVQTDGLSGLENEGIGDFLILGMGGELIWEILSRSPWTKDARYRFILQPMTKPERLRCALRANGYTVRAERAARVGAFIYTVLCVEYTGASETPDDFFSYTGRLWENPDAEARAYLETVARKLERRAKGLLRGGASAEETAQVQSLALEIRRRLQNVGDQRISGGD